MGGFFSNDGSGINVSFCKIDVKGAQAISKALASNKAMKINVYADMETLKLITGTTEEKKHPIKNTSHKQLQQNSIRVKLKE